MLHELPAVNPRTIPEYLLPQDPRTRAEILAGQILVTLSDNRYMAYDPDGPSLFPRNVPLEQAIIIEGAFGCKYPTLLDQRALPTAEECAQSPAMFSDNVMSCRIHLNPQDVSERLYEIFDKLPAPSQALTVALLNLHEVQVAAYLHHDKRFYAPLEQVVKIIEQEGTLPTTLEAVKECIPEKERDPYYSLCHHFRDAKILLHWYHDVQTLYVVKNVSFEGSSTGDRFVVVGSDKHRGLVEFAATFAWNVASDTTTERWEFYANDRLLYSANRGHCEPENLYELSAEWTNMHVIS